MERAGWDSFPHLVPRVRPPPRNLFVWGRGARVRCPWGRGALSRGAARVRCPWGRGAGAGPRAIRVPRYVRVGPRHSIPTGSPEQRPIRLSVKPAAAAGTLRVGPQEPGAPPSLRRGTRSSRTGTEARAPRLARSRISGWPQYVILSAPLRLGQLGLSPIRSHFGSSPRVRRALAGRVRWRGSWSSRTPLPRGGVRHVQARRRWLGSGHCRSSGGTLGQLPLRGVKRAQ